MVTAANPGLRVLGMKFDPALHLAIFRLWTAKEREIRPFDVIVRPVGGLVAWLYGGIVPDVFISRLKDTISVSTFVVGMIKAPFMAVVIGLIAATEGMGVRGSAESLGRCVTSSVVKSIFTVIVLDGIFAMFFAAIGW